MADIIRNPYVAGQFYSADAFALEKELQQLIVPVKKKQSAFGLVSPHAGYVFSGAVSGACFSQVALTETVIILGPNHTGRGVPYSIMSGEARWRMPMGEVEVDTALAGKILEHSEFLQHDLEAHMYEHSIEVQLPFLQYSLPEVRIVPIVIGSMDFNICEEIGGAIAKVVKKSGKNCLIVASSDMTHYESETSARKKDSAAIDAIIKLNREELFNRVNKLNISMCGASAVITMLSAVEVLGAKEGRLVKYHTSGDVSGDYSSVVGYAGIVIS